jgi:c-di-GMP-binding flagellar brake protein YcgR
MDERRRIERFHLEVPARIKSIDDEKAGKHVAFTTRDISSSGAFLFTDEAVAEGACVRLEFVLPVEKFRQLLGSQTKVSISVSGRVVRKDEHGIAVLFNRKYEIKALDNNHGV